MEFFFFFSCIEEKRGPERKKTLRICRRYTFTSPRTPWVVVITPICKYSSIQKPFPTSSTVYCDLRNTLCEFLQSYRKASPRSRASTDFVSLPA